ncbi:MAG TPA: hypothetical protein VJ989_02320 [Solirubrobacterales bacterium]|nr:hypothetical protein [Solirubrobacterales bacterium]
MTTQLPMACTLGTGDLEQRFAEIAALDSERLISREPDNDRGELLLSIAAPPDGEAFAAGLAEAFGAAEKQG